MKLIIKVLLLILVIQLSIFIYVKFVDEVKQTKIMNVSKELPQSSEYTLWDEEMISNLNQKIQDFNNQIKQIVQEGMPLTKGQKPIKISMRKKVENYAKERLGQKYVWGATGPNTFDCSGFTREVFVSTIGIKIPRVSRDQAKVGKYVKYKNLKRGDMVFFDTEKKYSAKVNHVGIYLNNGDFIHASSAKKKVVITNFQKKPFYKKRFLWGRRVIKNPS